MNLTHRNGHHKVQKLMPGKRYRVNFQLSDAAHSFVRGHRLRVAISTTYWPMIWPSPEPVELTVHTKNSSIELPVRPSRGGPKLKPFLSAEEGPPMKRRQLWPASPGSNGQLYRTVVRMKC